MLCLILYPTENAEAHVESNSADETDASIAINKLRLHTRMSTLATTSARFAMVRALSWNQRRWPRCNVNILDQARLQPYTFDTIGTSLGHLFCYYEANKVLYLDVSSMELNQTYFLELSCSLTCPFPDKWQLRSSWVPCTRGLCRRWSGTTTMQCCGWCHDGEDLGAVASGILLMDFDDHYWGLVSILGYNHNQSYIIPLLVLYQ